MYLEQTCIQCVRYAGVCRESYFMATTSSVGAHAMQDDLCDTQSCEVHSGNLPSTEVTRPFTHEHSLGKLCYACRFREIAVHGTHCILQFDVELYAQLGDCGNPQVCPGNCQFGPKTDRLVDINFRCACCLVHPMCK